MTWLAANWYGVLALFGTPAIAGVALWVIAHRRLGQRERDDREREARKLGDFPFSRSLPRR
jgi:hypothetical protein